MHPETTPRTVRATFAAALLALPLSALAAAPQGDTRGQPANTTSTTPSSDAAYCPPIDRLPTAPLMIVVRDKETGRLRAATAEEARSLRAKEAGLRTLTSRSHEGVVVVRKPDGSLMADVTGRFESLAVARNKDGKVELTCTDTPAGAAAFLSGQPGAVEAKPRSPRAEEK